VDCQLESAADRDTRLEPLPSSRSAIAPAPNIVYLNDWIGGRSLIGDMRSDFERFFPRSEAGRRLLRKRQKREQRRAEEAPTTLSEHVSEYKGTLPVDDLLAFINSAKITGNNTNAKVANSTPSKKERNIRRKKKQASERNEDSDGASVSTVDTSSYSGYEATASVESIADTETEIGEPTAVPDKNTRSSEDVQKMDWENDQDHFVVVQKKKKSRQPLSQLPPRYGEISRRQPYSYSASTHAIRSRPTQPVSAAYETCKVDDVISLTSDTESTSSYPHDSCSKTSSIRCSSPDFPDLVMQGYAAHVRRNSTGNVCESTGITEKSPAMPPSTVSYAIIAAGGLRPNPVVNVQCRRLFDSDANDNSQVEQVGSVVSSSLIESSEYSCNSCVLMDAQNSSKMPENLHNLTSRTDADNNNSEPGTPTGYFSADNRSTVSDDLAKESNCIKLQKVDRRSGPVSSNDHVGSLVNRKVILGCDQKTKLPVSPVVFLDIASDHRPFRNNLGVSFGFDGSDVVCSVAQSECSSSESGFSDCTVHTDADKISSVASTDSATSPIDPQDLVATESLPSSVVQTVTVGHCRPIIPFLTTTGHQPGCHTPVGIVPPIPQVDRAAEPVEQDKVKESEEDIKGSVITYCAQKDAFLRGELAAEDKQFQHDRSLSANALSSSVSSLSTACSVSADSFNLQTAQMFLYTGTAQHELTF